MNRTELMLSKISQTQKDKYRMRNPGMGGVGRSMKVGG
jgi:hypothetical protein